MDYRRVEELNNEAAETGIEVDAITKEVRMGSTDDKKPLEIRKMVDWIFSHNELVTIWQDCDIRHNVKVWEGEAWRIPSRIAMCRGKIIGILREEAEHMDYINIKYSRELWGMRNHAPILLQQIKTKILTTKQKYVII